MPPMHDASVPFLVRKLHATVAPEIIPSVTFFTAISVLIVVISDKTGYELAVSTVMLSVLSTMISFAISLRTSSAIERFNEGRRAWSSIGLASRNLAFLIWLHVPQTTLTAKEVADLTAAGEMTAEREDRERMKGLIEKRTIINLIEAFAVASKHYLRGEGGIYYEDLYHLVKNLPKYSFPATITDHDRAAVIGLWRQPNAEGLTPLPYHPADNPAHAHLASSATSRSGTVSSRAGAGAVAGHAALDMSQASDPSEKGSAGPRASSIPLRPAFNPPKKTIYHAFPPLLVFRPLVRLFAWSEAKRLEAQKGKRMRRKYVGANVPLEISMFLSTWVSKVIRRKTMDPPFVTIVFNATGQLQDSLNTLERVLTTPLPFAYQAHLKASIWAFLFFLPFQIYSALGYLTIVATCVTATVYLGFLEIANQVENPFGYDDSDLDLDHFCALISAELREIVAHPQPDPEEFVFSPMNQPFFPTDERTADEILRECAGGPGEEGSGASANAGARGEEGVRRLAAQHFHAMETLAEVEREMQRKGLKPRHDKKGSARQVEVMMV